MTSIHSALQQAQVQLTKLSHLSTAEARFESQLLLQNALNVNRAWLIAHENDQLQPDTQSRFSALIQRRLQGEPIAYILGYREFYGLHLKVTPATLIPRPDTEILVATALEKIPVSKSMQVLDLGTGSGAIALAIAQQRPDVQLTAVDASQTALDVAVGNGRQLGLGNVNFMVSDWFSTLGQEKFDLIVSNPPYIENSDPHLDKGDLRFEPTSALASGKDGLDDIRRILEHCLIHLKPQGWIMLEHGYNQAVPVADLMTQAGLVDIKTFQDFGGNDRVTIGKNPLIVSTHWD